MKNKISYLIGSLLAALVWVPFAGFIVLSTCAKLGLLQAMDNKEKFLWSFFGGGGLYALYYVFYGFRRAYRSNDNPYDIF